MQRIMINVDELWLKGDNQPLYRRALIGHVHDVLQEAGIDDYRIVERNNHHIIQCNHPIERKWLERLAAIPGINSLYPAEHIDADISLLTAAIIKLISDKNLTKHRFAVRVRRSYKRFPIDSMTMAKNLGSDVLSSYPSMKVDLSTPEVTFNVRVLSDGIYYFTEKIKGIGGLPIGTGGRLVCLLSGGFDSPVASYLMAKRGCTQTFLFFYAYPFVSEDVKLKIFDLVRVLARYQRTIDLRIIPFGQIQSTISEHCRPEYRTVLFRWFMLKCAEKIAEATAAKAILTGDSLGQVSSQTIGNIALLDLATSLPVFRPLLGLNKREIIDLARTIGTHDISVRPHDDACSLFAPRHPVTNPSLDYWHGLLTHLDQDKIVADCIAGMERYNSLDALVIKEN